MRRSSVLFSVLAVVVSTLFFSAPAAHAAGWSSWAWLEGKIYGTPAVTSWGPGRLDVFALGTDLTLKHRAYANGSWQPWESHGGVLGSSPAAVSWTPGRIDVVAATTSGGLQRLVYDGQWRDWETIDTGTFRHAPAISSRGAGILDIFTVGRGGENDKGLYVKSLDNGNWSGWTSLGGNLTSAPASASWSSDRIDVFAKGDDNTLHHTWWNSGAWGTWESLGGGITSAPGVASWGPGRLDVFARGDDSSMYHKAFGDSAWHPWEYHGGGIAGGVGAVSWGPDRIDMVATGTDLALYHKAWN